MAVPNKNVKLPPRKNTVMTKIPGGKPNAPKKKDEKEAVDDGVHKVAYGKGLVKPPDQLQLTEAELNEEITRVLTANNPNAPHNIVRYSFKEGAYKPVIALEQSQTVILFEMDSGLIHIDSEEARRLRLKEGLLEENETIDSGAQSKEDHIQTSATSMDDEGEVEEAGEEDRPNSAASKADEKEPKLKNLFNFLDRGTQTLNNPPREISCQTEPPPRKTFSATASQWEIYDAYVQELQKQEENKEKQKALPLKKDDDKSSKMMTLNETQNDSLNKAAKILERMVHQNLFDDIAQDFKYFEDPSDKFRGEKGTLLPLWKFQYEEARGLTVTALCWHNKSWDLFAVGMGSYNFCKQGRGMLLFYTLKNSVYPEYIYPTTSGVHCLDIHQQKPYLVAVGFYDGCVAVYNLKKKGLQPVYKSTAKTGQHTGPVWQVCWQNDDIDNNHNFYSVSSDSRVVSWTLVKNELVFTNIISLSGKGALSDESDGGSALDFHKQIDSLFLVGTQEGKIHKCSKAYSSKFLETYDAHTRAVDTVKWNHFHPNVFISCSYDWDVKIWDSTIRTPMFTFDLRVEVGDVAWAPYSSTVFAAVTIDGTVHVFDLNVNQYEAICQQKVVAKKKTKLTHIQFNPVHPIIIVGDDQGYVTSLKLSPNLRKKTTLKKGQKLLEGPEAEIAKMETLLDQLREPE